MSDRSSPRVIVRRMRPQPVAQIPIPRRPGQKMGLTRDRLLDAAKQALAAQPGPLTIKAVAAVLGVAHNAIGNRLKRDGTTLEQALAKDFLFRISRAMHPLEGWTNYLEALFADALHEAETHPGLARCVVPWIAQDPTLCPEFTEGVLHALGTAGLSAPAAAEHLDVVMASLCGMLVVRFPDFAGNPAGWAKRVSQNLAALEPRRYPNLHLGAKQLNAISEDKTKHPSSSRSLLFARLSVYDIERVIMSIGRRRKP